MLSWMYGDTRNFCTPVMGYLWLYEIQWVSGWSADNQMLKGVNFSKWWCFVFPCTICLLVTQTRAADLFSMHSIFYACCEYSMIVGGCIYHSDLLWTLQVSIHHIYTFNGSTYNRFEFLDLNFISVFYSYYGQILRHFWNVSHYTINWVWVHSRI